MKRLVWLIKFFIMSLAVSSSAQTAAVSFEAVEGSYKEPTGGEVRIRAPDNARGETGSLRFMLLNSSTPGDWPLVMGRRLDPGKPTVYFIEFAEGIFRGARYNIVTHNDGQVKELQQAGGTTIWTRQQTAANAPMQAQPQPISPVAGGGGGQSTAINFQSPDLNAINQAILAATNQARAQNGLPPLRSSPQLTAAAQMHATDMVARNFFSHDNPYDPSRASVQDRIRLSGFTNARSTAENILIAFGIQYVANSPVQFGGPGVIMNTQGAQIPPHTPASFAAAAVAWWMASPGHRANILSQNTLLGSGVQFYADPDFNNMIKAKVVQKFGAVAVPTAFSSGIVPADLGGTAPGSQPIAAVVNAAPAPLASPPAFGESRFPVRAGWTLVAGQKIRSASRKHYLVFQADGNLVVYTAGDQYVWGLQSVTNQYSRIKKVQLQADGNLAAYGDGGAYIWSALNRDPDASAYLDLSPEGVLQLVSGSGAVLWSSSP